MAKLKFDYIWLDGCRPASNLRSKTKTTEMDLKPGRSPHHVKGKVESNDLTKEKVNV